jgi:hypothetical protein
MEKVENVIEDIAGFLACYVKKKDIKERTKRKRNEVC